MKAASSPVRTLILLAVALASGALLSACRSAVPNRNPVGETFPQVSGANLAGDRVQLPPVSTDQPSILLVGYEQDAQFDADRWLLGLLQAETPARLLEVPTLPGLGARLAKGFIDGGMRSGIPAEDWPSVVTLYSSNADAVRQFTGNERGNNMRVLLLDTEGTVRWFHDQGYSAGKALELDEATRSL